MSAGIGIFGPVAGVMRGPWVGFIAGFIGAVIGMIASPGRVSIGLRRRLPLKRDVAADLGFDAAQVLQTASRVLSDQYLPYAVLSVPLACGGLGIDAGEEPEWALVNHWSFLGLIVFVFFAPGIWRTCESESRAKRVIGLVLNMFMASALWAMPWIYPYSALIRFPYEAAIVSTLTNWMNTLIPITAASSINNCFLIRTVRRGNLRVVAHSRLDGYHFKGSA